MARASQPSAKKLAAELEEARRRIASLEAVASDSALSRLTDSMFDGFSLLSADGVHLDANPALCAMTGFARDELIGVGPPHPYWPPENREAIETAFAKTLAGDTETFPLTFMHKDETRFPVLVTPSVIRDADGAMVAVYATVKDVSELKRYEAALAEREALFRLTFDQAPIGAALIEADGRFRRVNARFVQMTGYSEDELLERSFTDVTHPDDVARDVAQVRRLASGEIAEYEREKRYVRKDGGVAWGQIVLRPVTSDAVRPLAFVAMVVDVTDRRRAEQAVQREKESLTGLIDSIADEVWLVDDRGRFTLANPAALRAFGADSGQTGVLELAAGLEILRPDGTPRPPEEAPPLRALAGKVVRNQEEIVRTPGSGELRHRLVNATPLRDADGTITGCVCIVRDVTELRSSERAALAEHERYRLLLENANDAVYVHETSPDAPGTFLEVNDQACQMLGYSHEELLGMDVSAIDVPEQARRIPGIMKEVHAAGGAVFETEHLAKDGRRVPVEVSTRLFDLEGRPTVLSVVRDVTTRKQTERLLAMPSEILGIMAAGAPLRETVEGIVAALREATGFDAVGLRLQEGGDYPFIGATGYSQEFLAAENSLAARAPDGGLCRNADGTLSLECTCGLVIDGRTDDADSLFTPGGSAWTNDSLHFLETPLEEDPRLNPRNRCVHAGFRSLALIPLRAGEQILGLLHLGDRRRDRFTPESVRFFEGLGASIGVALREKQAEDKIRRLNAQLADRFISRTEQMEAATRELEALAYSVAHDVRAPLRAIDGFSALLLQDERERLSAQGVEDLRRVRAAAQTLARLLDDLTGLSRVSRRRLVRQTVDLSGLAEEVATEIAGGQPSRAVELTVSPGLTVEADPALLRLILRELLENAWKFTSPRARAHVKVGALDVDGERAFFVRDDGVGFDLRRAAHLFGVFQRLHTSAEFEGDGVGLATVRRLVRRHGGEVWAEAKVGEGATLFFTLSASALPEQDRSG